MTENNAATFNGTGDDVTKKDEIAIDFNKNFQSIKSKRRRGGVLRYPLEALTEHTDYLQIDIEEYVALGGYVSEPGANTRYVTGNYFGSDRAGRRRSDRLSKKPLINTGTILLPIPSNVQDTNNVQYDSSTLNGLAAAGIEGAEGIMNIDLGKNVFQQIPDVANRFKNRVTEGVRAVSYTHLTLPTKA